MIYMIECFIYYKRSRFCFFVAILLFASCFVNAQNSMIGDGFGGRSWYVPHNYQVGSYSANTVCGADSQLYAWGGNNVGQLANSLVSNSDTAVAIPGMNHVKFYSTGYYSAVLKSDNTAWVWGYFFPRTPVQVLSNVKFIDAGAEHVVFVKNDSTVWAVGTNGSGQLGNNTAYYSPLVTTPVQMLGVHTAVRAIAVGYGQGFTDQYAPFHPASVILLADGTVQITGGYPWFSPDSINIPTTVPGLSNIIDIKGSGIAVYALNANGEVYSFGTQTTDNNFGSLGIGPFTGGYHAPAKITFPAGAAPIIAISASDDGDHAFALDENGNMYGWGYNTYGQVGCGYTSTGVYSPVLCATNVIDIFAGETFSYILKSDNTIWAAGHGIYGNLFMNLYNDFYPSFTQLDPTGPVMHLCEPKVFGVIPVKLIQFSAVKNGGNVRLDWQSAMEENLSHYIAEYSTDGIHFSGFATIQSRGASSHYFTSHVPTGHQVFYRLKMVNTDGHFEYSEVRTIKLNDPAFFTASPNPVKDYLHIHQVDYNIIQSVELYSLNGELVKKWTGLNSSVLDFSTFLPGVYLMKLTTQQGDSKFQKIIKL